MCGGGIGVLGPSLLHYCCVRAGCVGWGQGEGGQKEREKCGGEGGDGCAIVCCSCIV